MQDQQMGLDRLREICSRRWRLGAVVACLVFSVAAGVAVGLPDLHRASATILVERGTAGDGDAPGELEARLNLIGQEIMSRTRLTDLIGRFGLYPELRQRASSPEAVSDRMRRAIRVELKAAQDPGGRGRTTAFTVSYQGKDPGTVAAVTNALVSFYLEQDLRMRAGTTEALLALLQEAKGRLDDQERRLDGYQVDPGGGLSQRLDASLSLLERLHSQLQLTSEGRLRALDRRASLLKELTAADAGGPIDADAPSLRLSKLRNELAELRRRYTDKHPDVQKLKAELAAVERQFDEGRQRPKPESEGAGAASPQLREALRQTEEEIRSLSAQESTLRRNVDEYRRKIETAPAAGRALQELARDREATRALYSVLLKRYDETRLSSGAAASPSGERFRILEPAVPPTEAFAPNRLRLAITGLVLALAAGLAAVILVEHVDTSFHSVDDVRAFTRVPVLVSIPAIVTPRDGARRRRVRLLATAAALLGMVLTGRASYQLARGGDEVVAMLARGRSS